MILDGIWAYISLLGAIIAILLEMVIYGRITAKLLEKELPNTLFIIRENWKNYLIVSLLIVLPAIAAHVLFGVNKLGIFGYYLEQLSRAVIAILTIYVFPIVFLKQEGIIAIPSGIAYLFSSMRISLWILIIVSFAFILGASRFFIMNLIKMPLAIIAVICIGIVMSYMLFISFAAAF